uniref:Uncharacterized protein n=1 Tax=Tanacetum cinerariifolium TaxID=118510 RepID=A0A699HQL5_TANCI|nr:hypothetical protein [Tanacetum cinerariifolium]
MAWLPKYEELERAVGGRNWLDMMIVYFDEYAYEQQEFTRRLNGLIGEMNEACADRITFVQELWSVPGEPVPVKIAVFLEEMMNKEGSRECQLADLVNEALPICDEFRRSVNSANWEPQFIYYCERSKLDDIRLARQINTLCDTLTNVIDGRWAFIGELETLAYKEVAEDTEKMENYNQLSCQLRNGVRMRDRYIRELQTSDMFDEVVESIKILKRLQLDDMEKASRLLLMAREIQSKVFEKNTFIARLRD